MKCKQNNITSRWSFNDSDVYNLDRTFSRFMVQLLGKYIDTYDRVMGENKTEENIIVLRELNDILTALKLLDSDRLHTEEENVIINKGLDLFSKRIRSMWL